MKKKKNPCRGEILADTVDSNHPHMFGSGRLKDWKQVLNFGS